MDVRRTVFALVAVPLAAASVAFSTPPSATPVTFDSSPTAVVASFRETLGEAADLRGPEVDVFGDGRVAVRMPPYMRRAGRWTDRLTPGELESLLAGLVGDGVLVLDAPGLRGQLHRAEVARRAEARRGEASLFEASDPAVTEITLHVNGAQRALRWVGLQGDAWAHPDVPSLQDLSRARGRLRALLDRPTLRREP